MITLRIRKNVFFILVPLKKDKSQESPQVDSCRTGAPVQQFDVELELNTLITSYTSPVPLAVTILLCLRVWHMLSL